MYLKVLQLFCIGILALLVACNSSLQNTPSQVLPESQSVVTRTLPAKPTETNVPTATEYMPATPEASPTVVPPTSSPTPTLYLSPTSTIEPLEIFTPALLRTGILPQTYIEDTCKYLEYRWSPGGSPPGTVVLPIMFHSIYKDGRNVSDPKEISETEFKNFVTTAQALGFETITTEELYAFLDHNAPIPPRSMIMIVDDRRPGVIQERIMPVLDQYDWSVTAAYITDPNSLKWAWELMDQLYSTGRVDIQSHGYSGQLYIVESTTEDEIHLEIDRSTIVLTERYQKRPIAFIWPGGNFTSLAVDIARQDDYLLGFTAYSRGPLMFNWIPLGEEERAVGDPLMLLPRAWSISAAFNLEQAVEIAAMAREEAQMNFEAEARWFSSACGGKLYPPVEESIEEFHWR